MPPKTTLCLTIGDPQGIGPEITAKLLWSGAWPEDTHLVVIGHLTTLEETAEALEMPLDARNTRVSFIPVQGNPQKEGGAISFMAIEKAVEMIRAQKAQALVTGPISKANLQRAGIHYSGHTEILENLAWSMFRQQAQADMLFVYEAFRLLLLTRHVPLNRVSQALTPETVTRSLENLIQYLQEVQGIARPRIAMLGVNPHAGEVGGEEERTILLPAMKALSQAHPVDFTDIYAADGYFRGFRMDTLKEHAIVSPYHDQGLIPFKMLAGFRAVNVTIGLPFIRTSVSHGTATDIAGRGIASEMSLECAVKLAAELSQRQLMKASR